MDGATTSGVPRRLLVLRHAKSSWDDAFTDDWERPLTERGVRDAARVGHLLRRLSLVPDLIITSDAIRAQATGRGVADASGYPGKVVLSSSLYHAKPDTIIEVLRSAPAADARAILIVAHNPGLEEFVSQLTGQHIELPTAALVHLTVHIARWSDLESSAGATMIDMWRPSDL
jgi:phosphohistidine phosphatase